MGKSGSGKTSMRSIIFANYIARDTRRLGATMDVEHSHFRFLGNLVLNLWDCGGQDTFMDNYVSSQRDNIFRNVEVLIYVFDVESRDYDKDMLYYQQCIESISQFSKTAKVFCLIHKMDLIQQDQRQQIFHERETELKQRSLPLSISCFQTSIWDETLYKAWSEIVYSLVPNVQLLESSLESFCNICYASEAILFERTTFLVISHYTDNKYNINDNNKSVLSKKGIDPHRFEKVSNIIKQFKLSCTKSQTQFQSMMIKSKDSTIFLDILTPNTYIMMIITDSKIEPQATLINIHSVRSHFQEIEQNQLIRQT